MSLLIHNIGTLVHTENQAKLYYAGNEMSALQTLSGAFVFIEGEYIREFGKQTNYTLKSFLEKNPGLVTLDAKQGTVFPSWVDSHTHLVYAGSREGEFVDRVKGLSYEEIASRGGGIQNSSRILRETSEEKLFDSAMQRLDEIIRSGTGAVEIKSGYGLDTPNELKMLRVIRKLKENSPLTIKSTFLGGHAIPTEYKNNKEAYINLMIREMMPLIRDEKLADYCDVFCEKNYFSHDDTIRILDAALKNGMKGKVHAEQLSHSGGIEAGIRSNAISVDHLEFASEDDIVLLKNSETMPVLLPGAQFFLGLQNPPARKMIASGCPVAISSDFNPGSCPSGNMNQMVSLACILYKMTPDEAIIAATTNSAYAIELSSSHGSIAAGKKANLFITREIPSYSFLPYYFGHNLVKTVLLNGKIYEG